MTQNQIRLAFARLSAQNPQPTTELKYNSDFELLIAVMLSAQSTDKAVNRVTAELFKVADDPASMLSLGEENLKAYLHTLGLYNHKAVNILATCRLLLAQHNGKVPNTREALEALPGVGRKTANVVLNTAFHQPVMAVDTHIFRVANRTGMAPGKTVLQVEQGLLARVPNEYLLNAHHWLILHGRYVCTARNPKCSECLLSDLCDGKVNL